MWFAKPALIGANIAYSEIPGVPLKELSADRRIQLLARLNHDACPCGCRFTLAHCRHVDSKCEEGLRKARAMVDEYLT
jgi:hypothetical protein